MRYDLGRHTAESSKSCDPPEPTGIVLLVPTDINPMASRRVHLPRRPVRAVPGGGIARDAPDNPGASHSCVQSGLLGRSFGWRLRRRLRHPERRVLLPRFHRYVALDGIESESIRPGCHHSVVEELLHGAAFVAVEALEGRVAFLLRLVEVAVGLDR